jgi:hypothetical protein
MRRCGRWVVDSSSHPLLHFKSRSTLHIISEHVQYILVILPSLLSGVLAVVLVYMGHDAEVRAWLESKLRPSMLWCPRSMVCDEDYLSLPGHRTLGLSIIGRFEDDGDAVRKVVVLDWLRMVRGCLNSTRLQPHQAWLRAPLAAPSILSSLSRPCEPRVGTKWKGDVKT